MTLFLLKLTLILGLGATVAALLRTRSAATRHAVWSLTLFAAAFFALASLFAPAIQVPTPKAVQLGTPASPPADAGASSLPR
ncbi:MAG TPA: hypothetical protein VJZ00_22310, partial [Thermoanaerobaculia bacterium]|nr:hypothetical protein [Thermoanaerobaculia bacterium]